MMAPAMTMTAPVMEAVSEKHFMGLGMSLAGTPNWKNMKEETNVEVFVTHFGASPTVCERIWLDLQTAEDPSLCVSARDSPLYLLVALRYLKAYPKDVELCGFFGINSRETIRKWKKIFVHK